MLIEYAWATYHSASWLHAKLGLIFVLVGYHIYCGYCINAFKYDRNTHSHIFYRWMNEIPVIFLVLIIILAVIKPF